MLLEEARLPPGLRIYAIGDIHGRLDLLDRLHDLIAADLAAAPAAGRCLVLYLGDYVDRGPDSAGVVDRLSRPRLAGVETLALLGSMLGDAADPGALEVGARRLAGRMAAVLQGSLLVRFSPAEVADVFCASRLGTAYDGTFGALDGGDLRGIVDRALPRV